MLNNCALQLHNCTTFHKNNNDASLFLAEATINKQGKCSTLTNQTADFFQKM